MSQSSSGLQARIVLVLSVLNVIGWLWTNVRVTSLSVKLRSEYVRAEDPFDQDPATSPSPRTAPPPYESLAVNVGPLARLNVPGIAQPVLCHPDDVDLEDDAHVIGVEVDGLTRAYVVEAFEVNRVRDPSDLAVHVVNDVIGGQPICVTHCNLTHSTRVLTNQQSATDDPGPIDLAVGGWDNGLVLVVDGARYAHHEPGIPLDDVEFMLTTWEQWNAKHPESLVYTGGDCES